jgi:hypothetical protein
MPRMGTRRSGRAPGRAPGLRPAGPLLAGLLLAGATPGGALLAGLGCAAAPPERAALATLGPADAQPAAGYEEPPSFRASELLPRDLLRGPDYRVREAVGSDGFLHIYGVDSAFGHREAAGDLALRVLIQEIRALAVLRELEDSDAFREARARAEGNPFVRAWGLLGGAVASVLGAPEAAFRQVLAIDDKQPGERSLEERRQRDTFVAFESAKWELAARLGVSPFPRHAELRAELNRVAWVVTAGGMPLREVPELARGSVAPRLAEVVSPEGLARIYEQPSPEDLRRLSRIELAVMGLPDPLIEQFLAHPGYSPGERAALVECLAALDTAAGREAFVRVAVRAQGPADPEFYVMGAQILRLLHQQVAPVERVLALRERAPAAYTREHKLVVPAQVDYLVWSRAADELTLALAEAAPEGLPVSGRELWLTGSASPRAREAIEARGIQVVEHAFARVFERLAP